MEQFIRLTHNSKIPAPLLEHSFTPKPPSLVGSFIACLLGREWRGGLVSCECALTSERTRSDNL